MGAAVRNSLPHSTDAQQIQSICLKIFKLKNKDLKSFSVSFRLAGKINIEKRRGTAPRMELQKNVFFIVRVLIKLNYLSIYQLWMSLKIGKFKLWILKCDFLSHLTILSAKQIFVLEKLPALELMLRNFKKFIKYEILNFIYLQCWFKTELIPKI